MTQLPLTPQTLEWLAREEHCGIFWVDACKSRCMGSSSIYKSAELDRIQRCFEPWSPATRRTSVYKWLTRIILFEEKSHWWNLVSRWGSGWESARWNHACSAQIQSLYTESLRQCISDIVVIKVSEVFSLFSSQLPSRWLGASLPWSLARGICPEWSRAHLDRNYPKALGNSLEFWSGACK